MRVRFTPIATLSGLAAALLLAAGPALAKPVVVTQAPTKAPTEAEVLAAQQAWCQALVDIGTAHAKGGQQAAQAKAEQIIDAAYGYQMGAVLFKPTLTTVPQTFRIDRAGALAYFVGGNPAFPQDDGFALKGWQQCRVDNAGIFISGGSATTMGKVHLTGANGQPTTVDKTWKFVRDEAGQLRIVVHHSSLEHRGG